MGNLSRNVVVESENVGDVSRRGHVMFMHTQDVVIDSVLFRELGRTNVEGDADQPAGQGRQADAGDRRQHHRPLRRPFPHPLGSDLQAAAVRRPQQRRGRQSQAGRRQSRRLRAGGRQRQLQGARLPLLHRERQRDRPLQGQPRRPLQRHGRRRRRRAGPAAVCLQTPAEYRAWRPRLLAARRRRGRDRQRRPSAIRTAPLDFSSPTIASSPTAALRSRTTR